MRLARDRRAASFYTPQALKAEGLRWQAMARSYAEAEVVAGSSDWGAAASVRSASSACCFGQRADRRHSAASGRRSSPFRSLRDRRRDMCQGQSLAHVVSGEAPRMTPKSAWRYVACAKAFGS